ncbi:DegT/DnrJ/EryC1/StrS family aminotransferase [Candidatus Peribacteria bacterium]|nr:DegT/DnrJ/EryC1/StrS family aminotransferase [Candidatus Peribacteria bacterium]
MKVPVNEPVITKAAKKYVVDALESGWVSSAGPYIGKFEAAFAEYLGVKHAACVSSGTAALHVALLSIGIGEGDEVIVPDFTMIASVFAILYTGATPVFVDVEPDTYNINVALIEKKITRKTKAIMPVHIYGHSVDMDPLIVLAQKHGLAVIEDAAEAHGAIYKGSSTVTTGGKKCGAMGDIGCFSFYGNKIITTGEGGMVVTDNDALAERVRSLKDLAHSPERRFWHKEVGYNYRMTNLQAALGLGQLESIGEFLKHKEWMAAEYGKRLSGIAGIQLPVTKPYAHNVHWMYSILIDDDFPMTRDALRVALKEKGIDTRDFFPSSASQPVIRDLLGKGGTFPVSEHIADRGLYLPSGLALTQEQLEYVCDSLKKIHG